MSRDRAKYLEQQARYNASRKGQTRDRRYEEKHPERRVRWEATRNAMRQSEGVGR